MHEIIVDNFAGGGGASTGIELAIGRSVDIAINHDENAIAMHKTNHPDTLHYCESVFDVDPVAATGGKPVGLAWFSPDCRHFSKAKGAKPVKKEIRGLAWVVVRWALAKRPRVMMLENVEEFKTWGPLLADEMRPDPERSGETFLAFVGMLSTGIAADHSALAEVCEFLSIAPDSEQARALVKGLGYSIDYRELRACDFGAPTIRKRFFMVMRCDGQEISWPEPTHGDPKSLEVQSGRLAPWRTAAECIDWSIPCQSIFERPKPLAENTLKRIARGIERFVLNNPTPFIVKCNHTSSRTAYDCFRGQDIDSPLQTITKTHGYAVVTPFIAGNGGSEYQAKPRAINKPAHTVLKESRACLVAPMIARQFGNSTGHGADEPNGTVTAGGLHIGEVRAVLMKYYGNEKSGVSLDEPLGTVTTNDRFGLVTVDGADYQIVDIGMRMLQPHELYKAQGFPEGYIIDRDYRGQRYAKDKQVARCGNAVPPPFARALVEANLPEMCAARGQEVAA
jgi:DNA (cytosine-5)-methyltransferase 1